MLTSNKVYSISKGYIDMLGAMERLREAYLIWSSIMLPKQTFIVWLAYQDRLLTKERLRRMHIQVDIFSCCLCDTASHETPQHLFSDCDWVTEVRTSLAACAGIPIIKKGVKQSLCWFKGRL